MKRCILNYTLPKFECDIARVNAKRFRARQVFEWVFRKGRHDFAEMINLPRNMIAALSEKYDIFSGRVVDSASSLAGGQGAEKILIEFPDGAQVEAVRIIEDDRRTVCLSSQSGCAVGCIFCASGSAGLVRSLTSGEMLEQVMRFAGEGEGALTNLVIMGMGEPLLNYDETVKFVRCAIAPWGLAMSARRITLSTVGIVKNIRRLADEDMKINLAISLHAADDDLRSRLVPANEGVGRIVAAAADYFQHTGREVTFEYVLLGGVNASESHASRLAKRLEALPCTVNVIAFNPIPEIAPDLKAPSGSECSQFVAALRRHGINTTLRKSRGDNISAACGQLRLRGGNGQSSE